ncbi:Hexose carrier protein HEX6 [Platanthera guangdongensis]|uniref:Hexose carrier protein HEX6 n=1 Tax=Platanthera guangdongensis TaxID=2320717 RepID=A0ABR2MYA0_9ASPA
MDASVPASPPAKYLSAGNTDRRKEISKGSRSLRLSVASHITERYGRRASILAGGTLFLAGSAVGGAAVTVGMLILARILLGFGIGFTNQSIPLYLSEMSPARYRGALTGCCFDIFVSFGVLVANLVNYGTQKITAGWAEISRKPGVFFKDRGTTDVEKELEDLATAVAAASKAAAEEHPFIRIFRRNYRPHLVMALFIPFFQQVTGINAVNFYAPVMFRIIGQKESASLMSAVITRCISLSCTVLASLFAVDRHGRRVLFIFGGAVMAASIWCSAGCWQGSCTTMAPACVMVMTAFVFFLLPETKGIPLDQMGRVWRQHWYWNRFVAADGGGDRVTADGTEEEEETIFKN